MNQVDLQQVMTSMMTMVVVVMFWQAIAGAIGMGIAGAAASAGTSYVIDKFSTRSGY